MGSLFSTPSVPTVSPVSYVPQQVAPPSTSINPTTVKDTSQNKKKEDDDAAVKDIIKRATRGRSSTIQTSFRGVLEEANTLAPKRKTLLGE
jgi:hypothetical protein